ncbi:MAG: hypothetical protein J0L75_03220 [Spirochaetes bacterium]|nr:hypothetical protein [Spirochaetota bacterium]
MNKQETSDQGPVIVSLAGEWQLRMDPSSIGAQRSWFGETFSGDPASLPGTVDSNPRQPPARFGDLKGFAQVYPYRGGVWYQQELEIPAAWIGKHLTLFLERCQWETAVWVDGVCAGTRNSLVAPHLYDLGDALPAGRHRITIMVDNANRRTGTEIGPDNLVKHLDLTTEVKESAKLNCCGHQVWPHPWNGILGRIELRVNGPRWIGAVDAYPDLAENAVRLRVKVANPSGVRGVVTLRAECAPCRGADDAERVRAEWPITLSGGAEQIFEERLSFAAPVRRWDEFSPELYEMTVRLDGEDSRRIRFGMRELKTEGICLVLNGRPLSLRGTLEDFIFPLTGHPPMDIASWKKVLATAQSYGLNFFRFHTCCPPEAAFEAADEMGFYFQVELPGTSCPSKDEGDAVEHFLSAELSRILEHYGNHPSMLTVSMGNEQLVALGQPAFLERHREVLARKVRSGRTQDPRHLYTSTSHPWGPDRVDDFFVSAWPVVGKEPLCGIQWGGGRVIECSRFNTRAPETCFDYGPALRGLDRPLITHEVGQWAVYPDLREISRYHGAQRAFNFEIIRERLREKGLLEWAADFTRASGMLALLLYREEIESALRTREVSGFMLLDLHDYPGQGTSTVGILSALWESKGLTTPAAFRAFCGPSVLLARLAKRVWTRGERLEAKIELSHYGKGTLAGACNWSLVGDDGAQYARGSLPDREVPPSALTELGVVSLDLKPVPTPMRVRLRVELPGIPANAWDLWVYGNEPAAPVPQGVTLATAWDEGLKATLRSGGCVVLVVSGDHLKEPIPGTFTPVFWNVQMKHLQVSKTMGLLCDPAHPALAEFPTDFHSNWQWWDPVMKGCAMRVDGLPPALRPIVHVVDSFTENRRLAMIFEARVGGGRLLVCSTDILHDLDQRPVARQLRMSLLHYAAGPLFQPDVPVTEGELDALFSASRSS